MFIRILLTVLGLTTGLLSQDFDPNQRYQEAIGRIQANKTLLADFKEFIKYVSLLDESYLDYKPSTEFSCNTSGSWEKAESVHKLRPSDIKVVAALGDSITAGVGAEAKTPLGLLIEYRALSWSIGGAKDLSKYVTIPNIVKMFNSNVTGYSTKNKPFFVGAQKFNVAISGQKAEHIPAQARNLIDLVKADKGVDFENDWKLVTIFIGGNDLCQYCKSDIHSPENYINHIKEGLDLLHAELPRTLVNFVSMLNIKDIKDMNRGLVCPLLHVLMCPCASYPLNKKAEQALQETWEGYTRLSKELVDSGRYDTRDDFTVVLQPFFKEFLAPRLDNGQVDLSWFAPDCFHFSAKSHGKLI